MRHVAKLVVLAVLGVALVVTTGIVLGPRGAPPVPKAAAGVDPITAAQQRLQRLPKDWSTWADLGMAYVQRARTSADPADYPRAQAALERSLRVRPEQNAAAATGLGALAAARHDFGAALSYGREALEIDPYRASALGVVADALTELGRYPEAFETVQRMVDLKPDAASYARASYAWELRGDVPRAVDAMRRALEAAAGPRDAGFARYHLGVLAFDAGDLEGASAEFAEGLRVDPESVSLRAGQARVRAARGDSAGAVTEYRALVEVRPNAVYAAELGDLLGAQEAQRQYRFAMAARESSPEGVLIAVDQRDEGALAEAREIYRRQPGIGAADALGWALRAARQPALALFKADEANRLGTRNAMYRYHRGMILADLGRRDEARAELELALRMNPYFSVRHGRIARETVAALGGAR